ncbi:MAG: ABC transporter ATP-binding protein [Ruminococcus sp.]|nr:ABC transporter ATP-binding protein [Ruminococcus sp.]
MSNSPVIHMESVTKKYYIGEPNELQILFDIALDINEGEFVSIVGASGSGKSTLMNIIGLLDRPTDGSYALSGNDTKSLDDIQLSRIRNKEIGFVFQNFNLIPKINAVRNVELPLLYAGMPQKKRTERAMELLELVGMGDRYTHDPSQLSGGQKQRVAIARAMANNPSIILADEPTGALDTKTGRMVMDLFHKLHKEEGKTIVLITHSPELAQETDRMITISDGRIISDAERVPSLIRPDSDSDSDREGADAE